MKQIKDYLHLYLGCDCVIKGEEEVKKITGISYDDTQRIWWAYFENEENCYAMIDDVAPILRHIGDITNEEKENIEGSDWTPNGSWEYTPETFKYLLSIGVDLFGLIDEGVAVNATEYRNIK